MKKSITYRGYLIRWDRSNGGYDAFIGTRRIFGYCLTSINRVKIAIDLWIRFSTNMNLFGKYFAHLLITDRRNYSGCYGKLISVGTLKKISQRA